MRTVDAAGLSIGDDHPPRIMGVLNLSQESPYDPSVFADPGSAAAFVDDLVEEGADIVDVGLESANKRFDVLGPQEELDRLDTAIETIESVSGDPVFSIETRYHEVADAALAAGFDMVNDVCGFADPAMPDVCSAYDVAVVKMASPSDLERPGALQDVGDIYDALFREGLTAKTIVDPAFGGWSEAKTLADDRETFRRLREFRAVGQPMLVSLNRKNFLRKLVGRSTDDALPVSLAATSMAVERGAHVVRTHDVGATRDAAVVGDTFARERVRDDGAGVEEADVVTVREAARHWSPGPGAPKAGAVAQAARSTGRLAVVRALERADRDALVDRVSAAGLAVAGMQTRVVVGGPAATFEAIEDGPGDSSTLTAVIDALRDVGG